MHCKVAISNVQTQPGRCSRNNHFSKLHRFPGISHQMTPIRAEDVDKHHTIFKCLKDNSLPMSSMVFFDRFPGAVLTIYLLWVLVPMLFLCVLVPSSFCSHSREHLCLCRVLCCFPPECAIPTISDMQPSSVQV